MRHYTLLLTLLILAIPCFAQNTYPPIIWTSGVKTTPDTPDDAGLETLDIAIEPVQGNVYIVANCYSPSTFAAGITITPSAAGPSTVIAKYDANGNFKWANDLGFLGEEGRSVHICSASLDGVYISSPFSIPEVDFGNGVKATRTCTTFCDELFVAKIESNGLAKWAKTVSGGQTANFNAAGISIDGSGDLIIAGNYESPEADFGGNFVYNNLPGVGFFLATYNNSTGDPQAVHFAAPESSAAFAQHLAVNTNGQMVLAGSYNGLLKFENGLSIDVPNDGNGYFVAGLAMNGAAQWVHSLSSSDYYDVLGIDIDYAGQAYLAIDASVDLKLDNNAILTINSAYAGSVLKLEESSYSVPVYIPYNTDDYAVMDVKLDNLGNIYTAGFTTEPLTIESISVEVDGCVDALLTSTSPEGLLQWARTIGGAGCEAIVNNYYASSMAFDMDGFLYSSGLFINGFEEDGFSLANQGAFIAKYNTTMGDTHEPVSFGDLQISPNPSTGSFSVNLEENPAVHTQLIIQDLSGREVYRQVITALQTEINTALPVGAYLVSVQNGTRLERQKLMVQR